MDPEAPLRRPLSRASAASALGLAAGALLGGVVPQIDLGLPATGDDPLLLYSPAILLGAGLAVVYLVGVAVLVRGPGSGAAGGSTERGLLAMRTVAVAAAGSVRASVPVRLLLVAGLGLGVALTTVETLWQPRLSDLLGGAAGNTTLFGVLVAASMLCVALGASLAPRLSMALGGEARTLYVVAALTGTAALAGLALAAGAGGVRRRVRRLLRHPRRHRAAAPRAPARGGAQRRAGDDALRRVPGRAARWRDEQPHADAPGRRCGHPRRVLGRGGRHGRRGDGRPRAA